MPLTPPAASHRGLWSFLQPFIYDGNAFIGRFPSFRRPRESCPQFAHGGQVIHAHALKPVTINIKIRAVAVRQILAISEEGCIFSFLLLQRWALKRTDCKDLAAKRGKTRSRCVKSAQHRPVYSCDDGRFTCLDLLPHGACGANFKSDQRERRQQGYLSYGQAALDTFFYRSFQSFRHAIGMPPVENSAKYCLRSQHHRLANLSLLLRR